MGFFSILTKNWQNSEVQVIIWLHSLFSECNYSLVLNFESLGGKFKEQKYNNTCYMKPNPHHGKNKVIIWYTVDTSWLVWQA